MRDIAVARRPGQRQAARGRASRLDEGARRGPPGARLRPPYAVDLTGWFDDFSHSGIYDALGGESRAAPHVNAFAVVNGVLQPIPPDLRDQVFRGSRRSNQRNRCPGANERGSAYKPTPDYNCDLSQVPPGN